MAGGGGVVLGFGGARRLQAFGDAHRAHLGPAHHGRAAGDVGRHEGVRPGHRVARLGDAADEEVGVGARGVDLERRAVDAHAVVDAYARRHGGRLRALHGERAPAAEIDRTAVRCRGGGGFGLELVEEAGDALGGGDRGLGLGDAGERGRHRQPGGRRGAEDDLAHAVDVGLHLDEVEVDQVVRAVGARLQEGDEALHPTLEDLVALVRRQRAEQRVVVERERGRHLAIAPGRARREQVAGADEVPRAEGVRFGRQLAREPGPLVAVGVEHPGGAEARAAAGEQQAHAAHVEPLQAESGGGHRQPHPARGARQGAGACAHQIAEIDARDAVQPPPGLMLALAAAPFEQDLRGRRVGVEPGPEVERFVGVRAQRGRGAVEAVVGDAAVGRGMGRMAAARGRAAAVGRHHAVDALEGRPQVVVGEQGPGFVASAAGVGGQHAAEPLLRAAVRGAAAGDAPGCAAVVERERHAVGRLSGQPDEGGGHAQLDPAPGGRQLADAGMGRGVGGAPGDEVLAPPRAVLPVAGVPLQHQRARRLFGVEVDPGEEFAAGGHRQRLGGRFEEVLVDAGMQRRAMAAARRRRAPGRE